MLEGDGDHRLTPQERRVAALVGGGRSNKAAARELGVSIRTVEFHLGNVYRKLDVEGRTSLANLVGRREPAIRQAGFAPQGNLPEPPTRLVGREEQLAALLAAVDHHRLVTVVGAGGVGKSRITLETARTIERESGDASWLVDLSTIDRPVDVEPLMVESLRLRPPTPDRLGLIGALRHLRRLILLDDCEHLLDARRRSRRGRDRPLPRRPRARRQPGAPRRARRARHRLGTVECHPDRRVGDVAGRVPVLRTRRRCRPDVRSRRAGRRHRATVRRARRSTAGDRAGRSPTAGVLRRRSRAVPRRPRRDARPPAPAGPPPRQPLGDDRLVLRAADGSTAGGVPSPRRVRRRLRSRRRGQRGRDRRPRAGARCPRGQVVARRQHDRGRGALPAARHDRRVRSHLARQGRRAAGGRRSAPQPTSSP